MNAFRHPYVLVALAAILASGCGVPHGQPKKGSEVLAPNEVLEFGTLYAENCAGCHGAEGRGGAAIALANPVYLAIADDADIRKVIYTTNAIESLNMTLRKVTHNHRIFPSNEAVYKVIYLAMRNIAKKWAMPVRDWKPALNRFAVEFAERFPK